MPQAMDKTHHRLVVAALCNFSSVVSYVEGILVTNHFSLLLIAWVYFGYSANYNTQGSLAILFLICSDLLNCFRSLCTMVITTESGWNSIKVIFTEQFFTKVAFFCSFFMFWYYVRPPKISQVQAKILTVRLVFPHYLSTSYDYGKIDMFSCWKRL